MRTVFISHSRLDDTEKKFFGYILSSIGLKAVFVELDDLKHKYQADEIRRLIKPIVFKFDSPTALFVILGKKLESPKSPKYTHNWVAN